MISKNQIKLINALKLKKYRSEHHFFIAEGTKIVPELLPHLKSSGIFATKNWIQENPEMASKYGVNEISDVELKKISSLVTPNEILGVFEIPELKIEPG